MSVWAVRGTSLILLHKQHGTSFDRGASAASDSRQEDSRVLGYYKIVTDSFESPESV